MGQKGFAAFLVIVAGVVILGGTLATGWFIFNKNPQLLDQFQKSDQPSESTFSATTRTSSESALPITDSNSPAVPKIDEIDQVKNKIVYVSADYAKFYEYDLHTQTHKETFQGLLKKSPIASTSAVHAIGSDDGTMMAIIVINNPLFQFKDLSLFYNSEKIGRYETNEYYITQSDGTGFYRLDQTEILKQYPDYNQVRISTWNTGERTLLLLATNSNTPQGKTGFIFYDPVSKQTRLLHEVNGMEISVYNMYNSKTNALYFSAGQGNGTAFIEIIDLNSKQQLAKFVYWTKDAITFNFSPLGTYLQMVNNQFTATSFNLFGLQNQQQPIKTTTIPQNGYHIFPLAAWSPSGNYFDILVQANDFKTQEMYFYDKLGNFLMKSEAKSITLRRAFYSRDDSKMLLDGISEETRDHVWRFYDIKKGTEFMPSIQSSELGQPIVWY